jgi:hypothetical protein
LGTMIVPSVTSGSIIINSFNSLHAGKRKKILIRENVPVTKYKTIGAKAL